MVLNSKLTESQDFHLSGVLLVLVATILGLLLSAAIFVTDQQSKAGREAMAQRDPAPAVAPPPAAVPAPPAPPAAALASPSLPAVPAAIAPVSVPAVKPPVEAPAAPAAPPAAADPSAGSAVFASSCGACHPGGREGVGPALIGLSDDVLIRGTREGVGMMPAFKTDRLSDQQLLDIIAFLRSVS
jgi:mono/diheme cytochrome c family protein